MVDFGTFSPAVNTALFVLAAAVVWWSGVRLSGYAKAVSELSGQRPALVGLLLLGGVASLPEMATTISAARLGNAALAVNTLLGGIAVTFVILALVDAFVGSEPLTIDVKHPILLLQAASVVLLLAVAAAGIVVGDVPLAGTGVGVWTVALFLLYLGVVYVGRRYERTDPWVPKEAVTPPERRRTEAPGRPPPWRQLVPRCLGTAAVIVLAGIVLANTGDALAEATGLGDRFVGLVLGGLATSLPELSTTLAAVRMRQYEMAFADAFGTNLFSTMLLFVADLAFPGPPVLTHAGRFSLFAVLLAIAMTAVYLAGMIERRNFAILRMGVDSCLVVLLYLTGIVILYQLR